jgi:hypothetical protein
MPQRSRYQPVIAPHDVEPFTQARRDILLGMAAIEKAAEDLVGVDNPTCLTKSAEYPVKIRRVFIFQIERFRDRPAH